MNSLADELNQILDGTAAGRLLSDFGRRIYFPKGIIAQSAEAKQFAHTANATIGMAYHNGKPMILSALRDNLPNLTESETVSYAPTAGFDNVRELWKSLLLSKNPSIDEKNISLPIVMPGITAGISYTADLFLGQNDTILANFPCWDNYGLIFETRRGAKMREVPFFGDNSEGLDIGVIRKAILDEAKTGKVRIILNFPNNPAGYSPTVSEVDAICAALHEAAENGADVLAICDDAYFGLLYKDETCKESIFSKLSALHEKILAVKADGPTKEDYVWGLRVAFLTFGSKNMPPEAFGALIKKTMGTIRSSVSCANTPMQSLLVKTYNDPRTNGEKEHYRRILEHRFLAVQKFVNAHKEFKFLQALPFNSGYFMSFECNGIDAETLRKELLTKHGIGTVILSGKYIRIAFSAITEEQVAPVLQKIYDVAKELGEK